MYTASESLLGSLSPSGRAPSQIPPSRERSPMLLSCPYLVYSELISELGPPTMGNLSRVPAGKGGEWNQTGSSHP